MGYDRNGVWIGKFAPVELQTDTEPQLYESNRMRILRPVQVCRRRIGKLCSSLKKMSYNSVLKSYSCQVVIGNHFEKLTTNALPF